MFAPRTLQAKLLVSVFLIVTIVVISLTTLAIFIEKERFQKKELERIYYLTDAMKKRLGHLIYGKNWRYLMITLSNAKEADQSMLFFAVTGADGQVLVSDRESLAGGKPYELTRRLEAGRPLYTKNSTTETGDFHIYLAAYFPEGRTDDVSKDLSGQVIFEAVHDIVYLGEHLGQLRVGVSRRAIAQHLMVLTGGMLGTGALVLAVILALIYWVIRRHMVPVESFIRQISSLDLGGEGGSFKERISAIPVERRPGETRDVHQLKQAFEHLRSQLIQASDQLDNHRANLERMVDERTGDLNRQIRERKEIEARLLTVQKLEAIGTLAGGIAHEFNNLFMAITGYATLIQKRVAPDHPNREKAEKIRELVETGSKSVQQLLGFARSGKYAPGPLTLNEVVRSSLGILVRSRKGLDVDARYGEDLWTIRADRSQMEQVVMNLLLNASEAMPEEGTIRVETRNQELTGFQVSLDKQVSGNFVCLTVADQGEGIPPELLPRVFDPFFTTKELGKGSGMGLASVFGIVENHGGFTTAESEPGRGSLFSVYLPAQIL